MAVYFVGREEEQREILKTLDQGWNVILTGKFGIGRTTLVKHIVSLNEIQWRFFFTDFSQTPGNVCNYLMKELFPEEESKWKHRGYRSTRSFILNHRLEDLRKQIIVLDNIGKLTAAKLDLIRSLTWEKRFQLIAIVENFLPPGDLFRLRVRMSPASVIALGYLSVRKVAEFFYQFSKEHHLKWDESEIRSLATVTGGYPLAMNDVIERKLMRHG
jgi:hypothetical protein